MTSCPCPYQFTYGGGMCSGPSRVPKGHALDRRRADPAAKRSDATRLYVIASGTGSHPTDLAAEPRCRGGADVAPLRGSTITEEEATETPHPSRSHSRLHSKRPESSSPTGPWSNRRQDHHPSLACRRRSRLKGGEQLLTHETARAREYLVVSLGRFFRHVWQGTNRPGSV